MMKIIKEVLNKILVFYVLTKIKMNNIARKRLKNLIFKYFLTRLFDLLNIAYIQTTYNFNFRTPENCYPD